MTDIQKDREIDKMIYRQTDRYMNGQIEGNKCICKYKQRERTDKQIIDK